VQLFPDQFWFETAMVLGGIVVVLSIATAVAAARLAVRRPATRRGPRHDSAFALLRIAGIEVRAHWTWVFSWR